MTTPRMIDSAASPSGPSVPFVVCVGPPGEGPTERLVAEAEALAALDLLERAGAADVFAPLLLATPEPGAFRDSMPAGVSTVRSAAAGFRFGDFLHGLCEREGFQRVLGCGAGAGVLSTPEDLRRLAGPLQHETEAVVANNLHSADIVGVTPSTALGSRTALPAEDNGLAFHLWRSEGLPGFEPERTAATQFDIDDPTDIAVAVLHPGVGRRLQAWAEASPIDPRRVLEAGAVFREPMATAVFAGRMGSATWSYIERETACRARVFSEERGMRSLGLEHQATSLLGLHAEAVGVDTFMKHLAALGDAAFIDTRVLLAHRRSTASREDRFLSDLGLWEAISDGFLREFTRAAAEAPVPVVLGGHSMVAGGLMALVEAVWLKSDARTADQQEE